MMNNNPKRISFNVNTRKRVIIPGIPNTTNSFSTLNISSYRNKYESIRSTNKQMACEITKLKLELSLKEAEILQRIQMDVQQSRCLSWIKENIDKSVKLFSDGTTTLNKTLEICKMAYPEKKRSEGNAFVDNPTRPLSESLSILRKQRAVHYQSILLPVPEVLEEEVAEIIVPNLEAPSVYHFEDMDLTEALDNSINILPVPSTASTSDSNVQVKKNEPFQVSSTLNSPIVKSKDNHQELISNIIVEPARNKNPVKHLNIKANRKLSAQSDIISELARNENPAPPVKQLDKNPLTEQSLAKETYPSFLTNEKNEFGRQNSTEICVEESSKEPEFKVPLKKVTLMKRQSAGLKGTEVKRKSLSHKTNDTAKLKNPKKIETKSATRVKNIVPPSTKEVTGLTPSPIQKKNLAPNPAKQKGQSKIETSTRDENDISDDMPGLFQSPTVMKKSTAKKLVQKSSDLKTTQEKFVPRKSSRISEDILKNSDRQSLPNVPEPSKTPELKNGRDLPSNDGNSEAKSSNDGNTEARSSNDGNSSTKSSSNDGKDLKRIDDNRKDVDTYHKESIKEKQRPSRNTKRPNYNYDPLEIFVPKKIKTERLSDEMNDNTELKATINFSDEDSSFSPSMVVRNKVPGKMGTGGESSRGKKQAETTSKDKLKASFNYFSLKKNHSKWAKVEAPKKIAKTSKKNPLKKTLGMNHNSSRNELNFSADLSISIHPYIHIQRNTVNEQENFNEVQTIIKNTVNEQENFEENEAKLQENFEVQIEKENIDSGDNEVKLQTNKKLETKILKKRGRPAKNKCSSNVKTAKEASKRQSIESIVKLEHQETRSEVVESLRASRSLGNDSFPVVMVHKLSEIISKPASPTATIPGHRKLGNAEFEELIPPEEIPARSRRKPLISYADPGLRCKMRRD